MGLDNQEPQICISCSAEFISDIQEPIPLCPRCRMEEQETSVAPSLPPLVKSKPPKEIPQEVTDDFESETQTRAFVELKPLDASSVPKTAPVLWRIRKADGKVYAWYETAVVSAWISEGKILPTEEVARQPKDENEDAPWEVVKEVADFKGAQSAPPALAPKAASLPGPTPNKPPPPQYKVANPYAQGDVPRPRAFLDQKNQPDKRSEDFQPPPRPKFSDADLPPPPNDPLDGLDSDVELPEITLEEEVFASRLPPVGALFSAHHLHNKKDFIERHKTKIKWGGAGLLGVILLTVFFVWGLPWIKKTNLSGRAIEKDAVDVHIAKFAKELGEKVQGKPEIMLAEAESQAEQLGVQNLRAAEKEFKRVLILEPSNIAAMVGLAEVYAELGAYREDDDLFTVAYDFADKAVRLDGKNPRGPRAMARLILRLNTIRPSERLEEAGQLLDGILKVSPEDPTATALKGEWHLAMAMRANLRSGPDIDAAVEWLQNSVKKKASPIARFALGQVYDQSDRPRAAMTEFSQIQSSAAGSIYAGRALHRQGQVLWRMGRFGEAETFYAAAVGKDLGGYLPRIALADLQINYLKKSVEAKSGLEKFLQENTFTLKDWQKRNVLNLTALALREMGKGNEAISLLEKLVAEDPYQRLFQYNLGLTLMGQGQGTAALKILEPLRSWAEVPRLYSYELGLAQSGLRDREQETLRVFQEAIDANPQLPFGHIGLYNYLISIDNVKAAENVLWRAARYDVDYIKEHAWRAPMALASSIDMKKTMRNAENALRQDVFSLPRLVGYSYLQVIGGNAAGAVKSMDRAFGQNPQDVAAALLYGKVLTDTGQAQRAAELLQTFLNSTPNTDISMQLAETFLTLNRPQMARSALEAVMRADPVPARGNFLMGQVYEKMADKENAKNFYLKSLATDPTYFAPRRGLYDLGF